METLDHEKFEGVKELAAIQTEIANGRAILKQLEASKDEHLVEREKEAVDRIHAALASSVALLTQIGENHDELVKYRKEVDGFVDDLRYLLEAVRSIQAVYEEKNAAEKEDLKIAQQKIDLALKNIARQRVDIDEDKEKIRADREAIVKETIKLRDERDTLDRAWKELRHKKNQ